MTNEEKDYLIKSQKEDIAYLEARQNNVISYANKVLNFVKKDHPEKFVTRVILKTIIHRAETNMTYEEIAKEADKDY